ncbi:MAG: TatD family hydrolase [Bacteroidetes bacterium]|nr:TatD family hydrolase [Bacteroidota bacterium]
MIIETHAHLLMSKFDEDRDTVINRAFSAGINKIIEVSYDEYSSEKATIFSAQYDNIFASIGVHPHDALNFTEHTLTKFQKLAKNKTVVAIGEIGLDYYRNLSPKKNQLKVFQKQLDLAQKLDLPVIIHCRDAHEDMQAVLKKYSCQFRGVIHSYSGDLNDANFYISRGFLLGIGGPLTYKNNHRLKEVVKEIDLKKIILETDAPYLPPVPHRGKRNEPSYLHYVVEEISNLKNINASEVKNITTFNAEKLFWT